MHGAQQRWKELNWWQHRKEAIAKIAISAVIVVYLSMTFAWLLPRLSTIELERNDSSSPLFQWWGFFGMTQNWRLFGPGVPTRNFRAVTWLGFEDGTVSAYDLPRVETMGFPGQYAKDKFRKWDVDILQSASYRPYLPALARYVGRLHYDPKNRPSWFMFSAVESVIPPPERFTSREDLPRDSELKNTFFYRFQPSDLP